MAARFKKSREASLVRADGVVWSKNSLAKRPNGQTQISFVGTNLSPAIGPIPKPIIHRTAAHLTLDNERTSAKYIDAPPSC